MVGEVSVETAIKFLHRPDTAEDEANERLRHLTAMPRGYIGAFICSESRLTTSKSYREDRQDPEILRFGGTLQQAPWNVFGGETCEEKQ